MELMLGTKNCFLLEVYRSVAFLMPQLIHKTNFIVNSQEVKIISDPQREAKIVKKCPVNLHNFEGSDSEKKQRIH